MDLSKQITITEGYLTWWQKSFAAICFIGFLYFLILFCSNLFYGAVTTDIIISGLSSYLCLHFCIMFAVVIRFKFNLYTRKYKREYSVCGFGVGFWKKLPDIEYVSVFRQKYLIATDESGLDTTERYTVNLWFCNSQHRTIYRHHSLSAAYSFADRIAESLQVEFLDASVPEETKWVNRK